MKYLCVDRGSPRCPCGLMESGQCYTCTMIRDGACRCDEKGGWQGVCPYLEYMQQGASKKEGRVFEENSGRPLEVMEWVLYGTIYVVTLSCTATMAEQCSFPGTFLMVEWKGYRIPVSVLDAAWLDGKKGTVSVAIQPLGPKTKGLLSNMKAGEAHWSVDGPFYNGLLRFDRKEFNRGVKRRPLVIARGMSTVPLVSLRKRYLEWDQMELYLDSHVLNEDFLSQYLPGTPYYPVNLTTEKDLEIVRERVEEEAFVGTPKDRTPILLLVSPYYLEKLTRGIGTDVLEHMIYPNHATMCCGRGICGACSSTDREGDTLRLCKCSKSVLE